MRREVTMREVGDTPILLAWSDTDHTAAVWCPFCQKVHWHGIERKTEKIGLLTHRGAHCHSRKSPFSLTGYYLFYAGDIPKAMKSALKRRRMRI